MGSRSDFLSLWSFQPLKSQLITVSINTILPNPFPSCPYSSCYNLASSSCSCPTLYFGYANWKPSNNKIPGPGMLIILRVISAAENCLLTVITTIFQPNQMKRNEKLISKQYAFRLYLKWIWIWKPKQTPDICILFWI